MVSACLTKLKKLYISFFLKLLKVTRHLCFKNSKNLQLLDVRACNSANEAAFQNPTNGALGKKAFCQILKRWIKGQNVLRSQIFAIFEA